MKKTCNGNGSRKSGADTALTHQTRIGRTGRARSQNDQSRNARADWLMHRRPTPTRGMLGGSRMHEHRPTIRIGRTGTRTITIIGTRMEQGGEDPTEIQKGEGRRKIATHGKVGRLGKTTTRGNKMTRGPLAQTLKTRRKNRRLATKARSCWKGRRRREGRRRSCWRRHRAV